MKALLLVAHGSRREASNNEIRELTRKLAARSGDTFADVRCAFLELAEPSIPDGIGLCAQQGAAEVLVLPYFLSAGRHVAEDIPAEIEKKRSELSDVEIRQLPYIGSLEQITDLLISASE